MAHFYGTVEGKGAIRASRQGSKSSGLEVEAMSWDGVIRAEMWHDETTGRDMVRVVATQHPGDKRLIPGGNRRVLYEGPVMQAWHTPARSASAT